MSGALLKYPLKPHDLADDLESFVHVLCFVALCFQAHSLSPRGQKNSENIALAQFMKSFFFEASVYGNFTIGGFRKMHNIQQGRPDFILDNSQGPLATLITELYKILERHYIAFDWSAWSAGSTMHMQNTPPLQPPGAAQADGFRDPREKALLSIEVTHPRPALPRLPNICVAPGGPASETQGSSSTAAASLPLADHVAMKLVFRAVMRMPAYTNDKTPDQFNGLPDPDAITPGLTGQLICDDTMSGSSKDVSRSSAGVPRKGVSRSSASVL